MSQKTLINTTHSTAMVCKPHLPVVSKCRVWGSRCCSTFVYLHNFTIEYGFEEYLLQVHNVLRKGRFPENINTLRPRQNGRHSADDTFKRIFMNENVRISINISLKFVPKGLINNIPTLVQIMAWRLLGDKPLSEPMVVSLLTHICVTRPQWVKWTGESGRCLSYKVM